MREREVDRWAEAFAVFARYECRGISCEHDEIWAGPEAEEVTAEDRLRLEELGWTPSEAGGFHRYV